MVYSTRSSRKSKKIEEAQAVSDSEASISTPSKRSSSGKKALKKETPVAVHYQEEEEIHNNFELIIDHSHIVEESKTMVKQSSLESLSSDLTDLDGYQNDYYYRDKIDPSIRFLYSPHSLSALVVILIGFLYAALSDDFSFAPKYNVLVGVAGSSIFFLLFGMIYLPNGPFIRPHPAFWRLVLGISIIYEMLLVFVLFQDKADVRRWLNRVDPGIGIPLPEHSYAEDCSLSYDNLKEQVFDIFVVAHTLGWFGKALIIRDQWLCWILSITFELLEYSLQHQLPNFAECWWDHWILDVLLCNWIGLYIGMETCKYFSMKTYSWRGIADIPDVKGKVSRGLQQLLPHSFTDFQWGPTKSLKNYVGVVAIIILFLGCELNAFYLKYLLYIPPAHPINTLRLCFYVLVGAVSIREGYQLISDPKCKRLGAHAWLAVAAVITESIICLKFGQGEFSAPFPTWVLVFWSIVLFLLIAFPIYQFVPWSEYFKVPESSTSNSNNNGAQKKHVKSKRS